MNRLTTFALTGALILGVVGAAAQPAAVSPIDAAQVQISYSHLTNDFYKKTDPQAILSCARAELA
ncbi:MAG: hypothetical protein M3R35_03890, partial [Candidatus Eremiobacteraeota bacterium]|nr:hypothetical protein [Candidatus Eremiobacteraeota bacterium]